MQHWCT